MIAPQSTGDELNQASLLGAILLRELSPTQANQSLTWIFFHFANPETIVDMAANTIASMKTTRKLCIYDKTMPEALDAGSELRNCVAPIAMTAIGLISGTLA